MIKKGLLLAFMAFASVSCTEQFENDGVISNTGDNGAVFRLYSSDFGNLATRSGETSTRAEYDFLDYYIVDESGKVVSGIKSKYKPETSEIMVEGLHEGSYRLLVLGIKGNKENDNASINIITDINDVWLSFPENLERPLENEYFYSNTPFEVVIAETDGGKYETIVSEDIATQNRIVGKVKFDFEYENLYIESSITQNQTDMDTPRFYTSMTANNVFTGQSNGTLNVLDLMGNHEYLFMPTVEGSSLTGNIGMVSRRYNGETVSQDYGFEGVKISSNHISTIITDVNHPDDNCGTMFISSKAYKRGNHKKILQDDENKLVYTDKSQRSFNTSQPLQSSITDDGQFHLRFYSPRDLGHVTVKAKIPNVCNEWFDFAYLDTVPAFADMLVETPFLNKSTVCKAESGHLIDLPKLTVEQLKNTIFKIESPEEYWQRLLGIKHGWTIYWGLFKGDPDKPDGGPVGNWMGIRPVHVRESIAFFLNFTYLIDMDDHERILNENLDKLYDDNRQPVTAEKVLSQMRQARTIQVGLVWPGNNVAGLGSPGVFGTRQQAWFNHYNNTLECSFMFHELGHVMGYGHNSSFTYGPWAEQLMNKFYIDNLSRMPIDSKEYLNSSSNPNKY
ncbi:MAG: hypothetical protein SOX26_07835 [Phocaeicola sp.]|nr:hypothetical protein [Phocaeicola sp.]